MQNKAAAWSNAVMDLLFIAFISIFLLACNSMAGDSHLAQPPAPALPVIDIRHFPATIYRDYSASLEGRKDIEIRPQVDGYLAKIYIDEGAYVRKGQPLFQIDNRTYLEQLNTARANLAAAKANLANAQINVTRLTPLVQNNVVSDIQLKTAQAAQDAAEAAVAQARAVVESAQINLGYASIKAPVNGYIGRIPHKTGSLVGRMTPEALTVISDISEVYAYFSMSEADFIKFKHQSKAPTIEKALQQLPPVELILPDGTAYPQKGKVQIVAGQFDETVGAITFRAIFPNPDRLLRSGNTGKVRIPQVFQEALTIPQEATYEIQDKMFVFVVTDSNKVQNRPISISGKIGSYYLVQDGLKAGEKIVLTGIGNLQEGMQIVPQPTSLDSLLQQKPLQGADIRK